MKIGRLVRNSIPSIPGYCETRDLAEITRDQARLYSTSTIHSASPWRQLAKESKSCTGHERSPLPHTSETTRPSLRPSNNQVTIWMIWCRNP